MTTHSRRWLYSVLFCLAIGGWESALGAEEKKWSDTAELSFVQTGGNTDVTSFAAKNLLRYRPSDAWAFGWKAAALYSRTDGDKSAERYETDLRADYSASQRLYYYGMAGWMQDTFAGLDGRYFAGPGVGYLILTGDRHRLATELGAQYAKERYTDGTQSDFLEGRAYGKYEFQFNEAATFSQALEYLHNFKHSEQYNLISTTGLQAQLSERLALKVTYEIRYDNRPTPADLKKTDTLLSVALVLNL